jgi:outer membrane immunogenic protein
VGWRRVHRWRLVGHHRKTYGHSHPEWRHAPEFLVGGRWALGYLVNPTFLTFASAGFTQAKFDGTSYFALGGVPTTISVSGQTYNGYFIGGGTEYALSFHPGLFWKTEYRFADYGRQNLTEFTAGVPNGILESTHPYVQTIRTELVWRFN